jgi:hypothetical protein
MLLLPPLEGASTVNGDPLMSNALVSNGVNTCSVMEEKIVADAVEEIWTISCIAAVDNSLPGLIINTLCLKEGRFPEPDASAIAMVEQLPPTFIATAGAGDDAPDTCDMVEGLTNVAIKNIRVRDRRSIGDHTKPTPR